MRDGYECGQCGFEDLERRVYLSKLVTCPFCQETDIPRRHYFRDGFERKAYGCSRCDAHGPVFSRGKEKDDGDALEAWQKFARAWKVGFPKKAGKYQVTVLHNGKRRVTVSVCDLTQWQHRDVIAYRDLPEPYQGEPKQPPRRRYLLLRKLEA